MIEKNNNASLNNNSNKEQFANFQKANKNMIATNRKAYEGEWANRYKTYRSHNYSPEQIDRIIGSGSLIEQQKLSRNYFQRDSFYKRIISYYANLYDYNGILIPSLSSKNLSKDYIQKKYSQACAFIDRINLPLFLKNCALNALIYGCYYGVIQTLDKDNFVVLDLPIEFCCSRYKNKEGIDLIEFDVTFFDTIVDPDIRKTTLSVYPKKIQSWYRRWKDGSVNSKWAFVPAEIGICFPFYDGAPQLLSIIPSVEDYCEMVKLEIEGAIDEVKKILVQTVPHLNDGQLLFEPDEAAEMHEGSVEMMKSNKNVSVLTTYADVEAVTSKASNDVASSYLEKMKQNIYSHAGASSELFAPQSNLALDTSINNDMSYMSPLIDKFNQFITAMVNRIYSNSNIKFTYKILPISIYNKSKYIEDAFKLANGGYSALIPALALGISQKELIDLKTLENDVLDLGSLLVPLQNAFTTSKQSTEEDKGGRPTKADNETSDKTEKNKISIEGGSN